MNAVRVPRPVGRPRQRPEALAGDKAYDSREIRQWLHKRKIKATIPEREGKKPRPGRPLVFDKERYKQRNVVERCVGWLQRVPPDRDALREEGAPLPGDAQARYDRAIPEASFIKQCLDSRLRGNDLRGEPSAV